MKLFGDSPLRRLYIEGQDPHEKATHYEEKGHLIIRDFRVISPEGVVEWYPRLRIPKNPITTRNLERTNRLFHGSFAGGEEGLYSLIEETEGFIPSLPLIIGVRDFILKIEGEEGLKRYGLNLDSIKTSTHIDLERGVITHYPYSSKPVTEYPHRVEIEIPKEIDIESKTIEEILKEDKGRDFIQRLLCLSDPERFLKVVIRVGNDKWNPSDRRYVVILDEDGINLRKNPEYFRVFRYTS